MAAEPITIFSHKIDPDVILKCLQEIAPGMVVTSGPDGWATITISIKRGLFSKPSVVTFQNARGYYGARDFPKQIRGMQGYFSQFPTNELTQRIMMLIASFRFAITLHPQPAPDLFLDSNDERLRFLFAVVRQIDGAIFTPSGLRDAAGRVLYHASKRPDPAAVMPGIYMEAPQPSDLPLYKGGTAPNPGVVSADRVAQRALCLGAIAWRGMIERENDSPDRLEHARTDFIKWVDSVGIKSELEPAESSLLERPVGQSKSSECMDAEWRLEGAAVLAWALNRFDLPPHGIESDVGRIGQALGLATAERGLDFLRNVNLRPDIEIDTLSRQLVGIHWRLREQRLRPRAINFEKSSQAAWFGKLPLEGVRFVDGDLAIGGYPISRAPAERLLPFQLVTQQRHIAINWLCGDNPVYSKTDTST